VTVPRIFAAGCILLTSLAGAALAADAPLEWDGLQRTTIKGIEHAYVRPGVDLAQYGKVILDPVQVSFAKEWKPRAASSIPVSQADRERIKSNLAALAAETFTATLSRSGGYPIVNEVGPDVMRVSAALADVYITAPDVSTGGRSRTYVMNAGRMTLVAELRDSETGALFARVIDQRQARNNPTLQWSSATANSAEARRIVGQWAGILRAQLDAVRTVPTTE
jgi:hypothetical protein